MESLQIKTGQISLHITDDDGKERGIFRFNPEDVMVARKVMDLKKDFEVKEKEFKVLSKQADTAEKQIALLEEIVNYFREKIDECYGQGTSDILFGEARVLGMFGDFFAGINPYYMKASEKRMNDAKNKIKKSGK